MTDRRRWSLRIVVGATIVCGLFVERGLAQEVSATHVFDSWPVLIDASDVDGMVALFSDDVVFSHPGPRGVIIGKEALRFFINEVFGELKANGSSLRVEHEQVSGSWGERRCHIHYDMDRPGGYEIDGTEPVRLRAQAGV